MDRDDDPPTQIPPFLARDWLVGGGVMGQRIRNFDWSRHPLGSSDAWPQSLKTIIRVMLKSRYAMWMGWGPQFYFFCNDAYLPTVGIKENWVLGTSARKVWEEIWHDIGPRAESVLETGTATWDESLLLFLERSGAPEETYHTFSYSPIPDDSGGIGGMLCVVTEDTQRVIGERRLAMLRELGADLAAINTEEKLFSAVGRRLQSHAKDLPFALVYLCEGDGLRARLACGHGVAPGDSVAPVAIDLERENGIWPVRQSLATAAPLTVDDLAGRFDAIPTGPWDKPARQAVIFPIAQQGQDRPAGFLIAGINPYRPFDTAYSGFINLLAGQIAAALASARVYEEERKRAAALAELDHAKTTFFSNVSHEFRTPLTLMLGPLNDVLSKPEQQVSAENRELLTIMRRNGQRLLRLVNTLLDFSRIEAGRVQAIYEPVDLAAYTSDLTSVFRSAVQQAGMRLIIDCPPVSEPVFVDRDMWEKIVLNLVFNAFKYTFEGEIYVSLRADDGSALLSVRDTGTGIPESELPNLFNRFHRVAGVRGRTQEGTGIGLALVQELVKLHGGTVGVESVHGKGSTFTVSIPLGKEHLPPDRIGARRTLESTSLGADSFLEEALRWLPDGRPKDNVEITGLENDPGMLAHSFAAGHESRANIVLADDNADMRDYVRRLLSPAHNVIAVANGQEALKATVQNKVDLVLTDVMMPELDGFSLLKTLRQSPQTASIPIILLSARAGEESRVEGLEAGADDYLIKPFSARELLARVDAHLRLARVRREADEHCRRLMELLPAGVYTCEAPSGIITYHNHHATELWGRAPVIGDTDERFCGSFRLFQADGKPLPRAETPMAQVLNGAAPVRNQEVVIERPDGSRITVLVNIDPLTNADGKITGAINVFEDVTVWKQAEAASRRLAAIVESSGDAIVSKDLNGIIISWNQSAERLFGYRAEEVVGRSVTVLIPPERRDEEPGILERIRRGERIEHYETVRRRKDGTLLDISLTVSPIRDAHGNIVGASKIARDITQRKQTELRLRQSEEKLRQQAQELEQQLIMSGRLVSLGEVTASMAHEFNNPLGIIMGFVEDMLTSTNPADPNYRALQIVDEESKRCRQIVRDLMDYARPRSSDFCPTSITDVVEKTLQLVENRLYKQKILLQKRLAPDLPRIHADPQQLEQVLVNLYLNAIDAMPEGGTLTVEPKLATCDGMLPGIVITVADTGFGIQESDLHKIFLPFFTAQKRRGLGLGLSICQRIIKNHSGRIEVQSRLGEGTSFTIYLPSGPDPLAST